MKINKAHCFFEQSGTFRDAFKKLGIQAEDYDIQNEYGKTDNQIDLFNEIEQAYIGNSSIFEKINKEDLIIAFFPCVRFSKQITMDFLQQPPQHKKKTMVQRLEYAMKLEDERCKLWDLLCKLIIIVEKNNLKLIIENPYSSQHYLTRYFFIKPSIIDFDRTERGDYFEKPTQYWFINCEPSCNTNALFKEQIIYPKKRVLDFASGSKERSLISPQYALQFIEEFIL